MNDNSKISIKSDYYAKFLYNYFECNTYPDSFYQNIKENTIQLIPCVKIKYNDIEGNNHIKYYAIENDELQISKYAIEEWLSAIDKNEGADNDNEIVKYKSSDIYNGKILHRISEKAKFIKVRDK